MISNIWLDQFVIWVAWLVEGMVEMVLAKEVFEKIEDKKFTFFKPCSGLVRVAERKSGWSSKLH